MCGIAGIVSREPITPGHVDLVARMNAILAHRGPDGTGDYQDKNIAMAMCRLSIIDVEGGRQPLYNEDRSLALIANGEIYNYIELRDQLMGKGHRFNTGSDSETIVHLYEDHGTDCVRHLRGMFAFALWDSARQRLILARDRMGEKPLYLYEKAGQLIFASELKALLEAGVAPFELDPAAVDVFFHYSYVIEPFTPIRGVAKLDAAHIMTVDVDPWRQRKICYWRMEDAPPIEDDPAEAIGAELEAVSELIIRSDVPVGIALSGGLDSSVIAALATRRYPGKMHAFSIGYPGRPPCDERFDALALADHLEMPFHDVELSTTDMVSFFPELLHLRDDPIADIAGYGYYAVMKLAREQGVPVMLQGQGGDELFWGYPWTVQAVDESLEKCRLRRMGWFALPSYLRLNMPDGLRLWQIWRWMGDGFGIRSGLARFNRHRTANIDEMVFYDAFCDFRMAQQCLGDIYAPEFMERLRETGRMLGFPFPRVRSWMDIEVCRLVSATYLRENGIAQADRLSMASSVELRLPLVDHKLVETVMGLRKMRKDYRLPPKHWFKAAVRNVVPKWIMDRPKRGFTPPVQEWRDALFAAYGDQLIDGCLARSGVLTTESAKYLSSGPPSAFGVATPLCFKALALEMWCRQMSARAC